MLFRSATEGMESGSKSGFTIDLQTTPATGSTSANAPPSSHATTTLLGFEPARSARTWRDRNDYTARRLSTTNTGSIPLDDRAAAEQGAATTETEAPSTQRADATPPSSMNEGYRALLPQTSHTLTTDYGELMPLPSQVALAIDTTPRDLEAGPSIPSPSSDGPRGV